MWSKVFTRFQATRNCLRKHCPCLGLRHFAKAGGLQIASPAHTHVIAGTCCCNFFNELFWLLVASGFLVAFRLWWLLAFGGFRLFMVLGFLLPLAFGVFRFFAVGGFWLPSGALAGCLHPHCSAAAAALPTEEAEDVAQVGEENQGETGGCSSQ